MYADYLVSCGMGKEAEWTPGKSGGNRRSSITSEVESLLRKMLSSKPPAPYAFAASEASRLCHVPIDRATVRRWAINAGLAHVSSSKKKQVAAVRRWQRAEVGALWQLDASPHQWFPGDDTYYPLLDMIDDCSRVMVGSRLYPRECLLAYMDFLPRAFEAYGVPLVLYVDYHSFFFSHVPENRTYIGDALRRYDVHLEYAPTPEAKGKVERQHLFWQNRLPSFFAAHHIQSIKEATHHLEDLRLHHNAQEVHREIEMIPDHAWRRAKREGRCLLRPCRPDPWWRYIWSVRQRIKLPLDGTVSIDGLKFRLGCRSKWALRCDHPDGMVTYLANEPGGSGKPIVLFQYQRKTPLWTS